MPKETKRGFTIVELLTVMSIIIILIGLLVPALNRVRKVAKDVTQKGQFYDIAKALTDYRTAHQDEYPDSNMLDYDVTRTPYCGAMKLCEALVGQDGMGNNPVSRLLAIPGPDGLDPMYPFDLCLKADPASYLPEQTRSMKKRIRYLENPSVRAAKLDMLYGTNVGQYNETGGVYSVLTDVYNRVAIDNTACPGLGGDKVGMPILYYKADVRKFSHDANEPTVSNPDNIYNYMDNHDLVALGLPWDISITPPLASEPSKWFYERITNPAVTATPTPYMKDDYILISAGYDGVFGTFDDIFNFGR
jgi:type II secretory pathway pseudopilin PulG